MGGESSLLLCLTNAPELARLFCSREGRGESVSQHNQWLMSGGLS
jgi:hypothetical protein